MSDRDVSGSVFCGTELAERTERSESELITAAPRWPGVETGRRS